MCIRANSYPLCVTLNTDMRKSIDAVFMVISEERHHCGVIQVSAMAT